MQVDSSDLSLPKDDTCRNLRTCWRSGIEEHASDNVFGTFGLLSSLLNSLSTIREGSMLDSIQKTASAPMESWLLYCI